MPRLKSKATLRARSDPLSSSLNGAATAGAFSWALELSAFLPILDSKSKGSSSLDDRANLLGSVDTFSSLLILDAFAICESICFFRFSWRCWAKVLL